jgi:hypothetical protein
MGAVASRIRVGEQAAVFRNRIERARQAIRRVGHLVGGEQRSVSLLRQRIRPPIPEQARQEPDVPQARRAAFERPSSSNFEPAADAVEAETACATVAETETGVVAIGARDAVVARQRRSKTGIGQDRSGRV